MTEIDRTIPKLSRCAAGMKILAARGDENVSAQNDVIYAGGSGKELKEYPPEVIEKLEKFGWFWDDQYESWGFFT